MELIHEEERYFLQTTTALSDFVDKIGKKDMQIQRFKGLGEMNPEQLWDTTLNPANRRLLKVEVKDDLEAEEVFSTLMGDVVEPRRNFIINNSLDADLDVA